MASGAGEERQTLFLQMATVVAVTLLAVNQIEPSITGSDEPSPESTRTEQLLDDRLNGGQLEVLPAEGRPVPLDVPLQGSQTQSNQEAQGGLQEQQGDLQRQEQSSELQPNAGVDQLPDDFDF